MNRPSMPVQSPNPDDLRKAHSEIDRRVRELDRRAILTPEEQTERTELKKRKLALKDLIDRVSSLPPPPPPSMADEPEAYLAESARR